MPERKSVQTSYRQTLTANTSGTVISTLKIFFGRPKQFFDHMIQKATIAEAAPTVVSTSYAKPNNIHTHTRYNNGHLQHMKSNQFEQSPNTSCLVCQITQHQVSRCEKFKNLTHERKQLILRDNGFCFKCLKTHGRRYLSTKPCGVGGCESRDHPLPYKDKQNSMQHSNFSPSEARIR